MSVLEGELKKEITKNEQLTGVIVSMQKSLNQIDSDKRVKNLMINGLVEGDVTSVDGTVTLQDDNAKIKSLLHNIGVNNIDDAIDGFECTRIGNPTEEKKRILKSTLNLRR